MMVVVGGVVTGGGGCGGRPRVAARVLKRGGIVL